MTYRIAAVLLVAGCYRSRPPAPPPPAPRPAVEEPAPSRAARAWRPAAPTRTAFAAALARLTELTDQMCACTDKQCADAVMAELTQWSTELSRSGEPPESPTEDEARETTAITERLSQCMMASMNMATPAVPGP